MTTRPIPPEIPRWFAERGWRMRHHQIAMFDADARGEHALLVADTGAGKTLGGFLPTLADFCPSRGKARRARGEGVHTLYVSPLKALAQDVRRNLLTPIEEMGLDIAVETRSGDTPANRKARQRARPPDILLTTPESLSLLLSWPEAETMFASLERVVIDEVHAFAHTKRGDLLALALSRLQTLAPNMRRAALSATLDAPQDYAAWLAPWGAIDEVAIVEGERAAAPQIDILLPEDRAVPWSGHAGRWAIEPIYREIARHRTTLVFTNTRFLAEYVFQMLWEVNEDNLPIAIHHGSLSSEQRRKVEAAMARGELRALVCTSSLELGIDWGDIDLVVQMGAPKGVSRLLQRIGRAGHRLDCPSRALIVPGNRFEFLEARAALDAIVEGERDGPRFRKGALDVLAQHILGRACAGPFDERELRVEINSCLAYAEIDERQFARILHFVESGGYALKAYDRFKRITRQADGRWRLTHPQHAQRYRMNAGIIVDSEMLEVRYANGRRLGRVEERFAASLAPGDAFVFAGASLEVVRINEMDVVVRPARASARVIPSYGGQRMPISSDLAERVRALLANRAAWGGLPDEVREWLEVQERRSQLPAPDRLLIESFAHRRMHYCCLYTFEGWNANQSLGMLLTRRMETQRLAPGGFVANDYALAVWSLRAPSDPVALLSPEILEEEFVDWVSGSYLLRRAFREVAVISGLVERAHFGKRKSGRQVTFSTDLIFDVLQKHEPDHLLIEAAWADARERLTDVERLATVLETSAARALHLRLERVSPLAVPLLSMIGRESVPPGSALDEELLAEAESLAQAAMRLDEEVLDEAGGEDWQAP